VPEDTIQSIKEELIKHIECDDYELFYLYSFEELRTLRILKEIAEKKGIFCYLYDHAEGLRCEHDKKLKLLKKETLRDFQFVLNWVEENARGFVVLLNPHKLFETDMRSLRLFKNTILRLPELKERERFFLKFFIISDIPTPPDEIQREAFYIDIPLPAKSEIQRIVEHFFKELGLKSVPASLKNKFVTTLQGLTEVDIVNIMKYCLEDGKLTEEDLENIVGFKKQLLKKESLLEFLQPKEDINDIGGLKNLKEWLTTKTKVIENLGEAIEFGVDVPKGILLFGMPGCGKSLLAKVIAKRWNYPLLRLDMGMVLGPYVGQSEENIRKAIKIAEAVAPCVLWIDEIEKGFSGVSSDGGGSSDVIKRIFGTFLTWMQEKKAPVFVVATANDISQMPPEFLRKGRFDELFFFDFPSEEAITEILKIHLRKRHKEEWFERLKEYSSKLKGYSGADVEAMVKELVELAFIAKVENKDFDIIGSFNRIYSNFKPFSKTHKKAVEEIRKKLEEIDAKPVE